MSDRRSPPAGRAAPVPWDPQAVEGQGQNHAQNHDQTQGHPPRQAVPFGTRSTPAHVQHAPQPNRPQPGAHPLWSALPQNPHSAPQPDIPPVHERTSLMDRFKRRASEDPSVPTKGNRKPFLLGVLTGVVATLLIGQIFSAATPAPDYSYAPPPAAPDVNDSESEAGAESAIAFLDQVEGLD